MISSGRGLEVEYTHVIVYGSTHPHPITNSHRNHYRYSRNSHIRSSGTNLRCPEQVAPLHKMISQAKVGRNDVHDIISRSSLTPNMMIIRIIPFKKALSRHFGSHKQSHASKAPTQLVQSPQTTSIHPTKQYASQRRRLVRQRSHRGPEHYPRKLWRCTISCPSSPNPK